MTPYYYQSCSDLFIHNFDMILKTSNYMCLVVGYDGYRDVTFNEEKVKEIWNKIYDEYCKLSDDNRAIMYYETLSELGALKVRKFYVSRLLDQMEFMEKTKEVIELYIDALSKWRFFLNKDKPLESELIRMRRQLRAATNKIELKEDEIKDLRDDESEPMSLTIQAVKLEQALERNEINTRKTTVEKWVAMLNEVKLINEHRRKNKRVA